MQSSVKVDLYKYVSMQIETLKFGGIWFYIPHVTKSFKFWTSLLYRFLVGIFIFILPTGGQIIYLIKLMSYDAEIQEVVAIINLVFTELLTSVKLLDLFLRRHLLTQLVKQINNEDLNLVPRANLDAINTGIKFSRRLFVWLFFSAAFDIFVHVVVVPALNGFRTLPLKMDYLFFDVNDYFLYICAYQILYKPIMVFSFVAVQSLSWAFMICAIGQLDILIYNLENMKELVNAAKTETNCDENEAFENIFKKCLHHHRVIKRYVKTLQSTFGGQFASNLSVSACIICTTAVQILSIESPLDNIIEIFWVFLYLLVFIIILFVDCYLGNYVTMKSGHISTVVYNCPWVNLRPELKKNLIIFIAETQNPLVIRAGNKLVPVSLDTFTTVFVFLSIVSIILTIQGILVWSCYELVL